MPNPYIQVALTYFRNPFRSINRSLLTSGILFLLSIFFFIGERNENHHVLKPFQLLLFMVFFAYWATHLKEQFACSRASLTPDFRKVHSIVATIAAVIFSVFLPGVIAPLIGWQPLGFISITTFLFGFILWFILRPGFTTALFITAGWTSILFPPIQKGLEQIACGQKPLQAFTFLIAGTVISIIGIIRLFLLNEEMPEYHLNLVFPIDGRIKMSDLQWQKMEKWHARGWRHRWTNKPIANMIYHARHATDSYWSRVSRWSYSNTTVRAAIFIAILINLGVTVMDFLNGKSLPVPIQFFFATFMPVSMVIGLFNVKNRFIVRDLMMPVRKNSYLRELGMSVASSQFLAWFVLMTVSIVWMFNTTIKPTPDTLSYTTAYSLMMQVWLFGLAVWILSYRSILITLLIINIVVVFTTIPILAFEVKFLVQWRPFILLFGGLLAVIGLLLTGWGYRRWLVADFH